MISEIIAGIVGGLAVAAIIGIRRVSSTHLLRRRATANENLNRIMKWFQYINTKLDSPEFSLSEIDTIEKEIDYHFKLPPLRNYLLRFKKRFRESFLREMGIKQELQKDLPLFLRYARLDLSNTDLQLALLSKADHRVYSVLRLPFGHYWRIISANFLHFHSQHKSNWSNTETNGRRYTIADVEVPISLLRLYFRR